VSDVSAIDTGPGILTSSRAAGSLITCYRWLLLYLTFDPYDLAHMWPSVGLCMLDEVLTQVAESAQSRSQTHLKRRSRDGIILSGDPPQFLRNAT